MHRDRELGASWRSPVITGVICCCDTITRRYNASVCNGQNDRTGGSMASGLLRVGKLAHDIGADTRIIANVMTGAVIIPSMSFGLIIPKLVIDRL